jgi:TPR repeat protein
MSVSIPLASDVPIQVGDGGPPPSWEVEHRELLATAASQSDGDGETWLARALHAHRIHPPLSVDCFEKAAALGDADAMGHLSFCLQRGRGCAVNEERAWDLAQRSHALGSWVGTSALARCHSNNVGTHKNLPRALELYRLADAHNEPSAMNGLGYCFDTGTGVEKDAHKGVEYYRKAADLGYFISVKNLGVSYAEGMGVPKDDALAVSYYRRAAGSILGMCAKGMHILRCARIAPTYYMFKHDIMLLYTQNWVIWMPWWCWEHDMRLVEQCPRIPTSRLPGTSGRPPWATGMACLCKLCVMRRESVCHAIPKRH